MIGAFDPTAVQMLVMSLPCRAFAVACCGECGTRAGTVEARCCNRTKCGLLDRQSHGRRNAA